MSLVNGKMLSSWSFMCLTLIYLWKVNCNEETESSSTTKDLDERQPFWNIAHMVNSIEEVDKFLGQGANGIEFDITFEQGKAIKTYHGKPCDHDRDCEKTEDLVKYLEYMRKITSPDSPQYKKKLVLLFVDCKVTGLGAEARKQAGEDLASKFLKYYWQNGTSGATAYVIISVQYLRHKDFLEKFKSKLMESENYTYYKTKIGYNFSGLTPLEFIPKAYESVNISQNIWQGDGITNWFQWLFHRYDKLKYFLRQRDKSESFVDKVYWWTVDKERHIQKVLRLRVDALITNYPFVLRGVLKETEFSSKFRNATLDDSPWETFKFRNGSFPTNFPG